MQRIYPVLFVLLWSTGFIGARFGLPHAEPLSFLFVRYLLVLGLMGLMVAFIRPPWPSGLPQWGHIAVTGLLVHGVYLGGVFMAIDHGLPAGATALVVGMQPLLTALVAGAWLKEVISPRQWLGLALGFGGVVLVLAPRVGEPGLGPMLWPALAALFAISVGTLYQKRFCARFDLRTGALIQFAPCAVLTGLAVWAFEDFAIQWTGEFVFALAWLVLVLSLGAVSLLNVLIREGSAVNVARLFYLVPPTTALIAWMVFDESLHAIALGGMAIAVLGVALAGSHRRG